MVTGDDWSVPVVAGDGSLLLVELGEEVAELATLDDPLCDEFNPAMRPPMPNAPNTAPRHTRVENWGRCDPLGGLGARRSK